MKRILTIALALVLLVGMLVVGAAPAAGASVTPIYVPGNPGVPYPGYDYGFRVDYGGGMNVNGTHPIILQDQYGNTYPTPYTVTITTADGVYFDWVSDLPVDAVIAKGGPGANVFVYDPESYGDTGLYCPNNSSGQPAAISHIDFAFSFELDAEKTAETSFTRTWDWTIAKSVTPAIWELFAGDSGTSAYTVTVTKTGFTDSDWAVGGTIIIANNTPFPAFIASADDFISGLGPVAVSWDYPIPGIINPGQVITGTYGAPLPDGSERVNTVTVITDPQASPFIVSGAEAAAPIIFGEPTTQVNDSVNVTDTNGESWLFYDSGTVSYERTFDTAGVYGNTATIVETGQSADASVTVSVYELEVGKTAETDFIRTYLWAIDKVADYEALLLTLGQVSPPVNYTVTVTNTGYTDSEITVTGSITVYNPAPMPAVINSVADILPAGIAGVVEIVTAVDYPYTMAAGEELVFLYTISGLPEVTAFENTGLVTIQNYDYAPDGEPAMAGTTSFSGVAPVAFGAASDEIDETVSVSDTNTGPLGDVSVGDSPAVFNYSLTFGPYGAPGEYSEVNTASFVTNDTQTPGEDSWTVIITVPQTGIGATLTQGYWKTHSSYGPAPYDDTWAAIGEDTEFFGSGMSYYEVLWAKGRGDAWYILAVQYIAAELNFINGADPTDAQAAFDEATALFTENPAPEGKKADYTELAIYLAGILDDYNNGIIGPGHADE